MDSYRLCWAFTLLRPGDSLTCAGFAARRLDAHVLVLVLGYCRDRTSELKLRLLTLQDAPSHILLGAQRRTSKREALEAAAAELMAVVAEQRSEMARASLHGASIVVLLGSLVLFVIVS